MIHPILSKTYGLDDAAQGAYEMHHNLHAGKIGILVGAPEEGLGVRNTAQREQHLEAIETFRAFD
jgi:crotonyl-CoA reductase